MAEDGRRAAAVIVAGGSGARFSSSGPRKQYRLLRGEPVLSWAVRPFVEHADIGNVVVVLPREDAAAPPDWLVRFPVRVVAGGSTRGESVRNGLEALGARSADVVLIHDGARPFVSRKLIDRVLGACDGYGIIPGLPLTDTLKEVDGRGMVVATPDRERFRRIQTPQAFPLATILDIHRQALLLGMAATDDAALFEHFDHPVRVVEGDPDNIKVTVPIDFDLAELLASRLLPISSESASADGSPNALV